MEKLSWNDKFLTGNLIIDDHHKKLFVLFDQLISVNEKTPDKELEVLKIIDEFIDYTVYHFNAEKEIAQFLHLDLFNEHDSEHSKFTYTVQNFKKRLSVDYSESVKNELGFYIYNWIGFHILTEDKKIFTLTLK